LIISADDFGRGPKANRNILSLAQAGKIDRVAILVNRHFSEKEIDDLVRSRVKIDLHFDYRVVHENRGNIMRSSLFLLKHYTGWISSRKVSKIWEDQMEKFIEIFKRKPDGLNSHQHIHFFPPYFRIVLKLGKKYQIPYIRFGKKGFIKSHSYVYYNLSYLWKKNLKEFVDFQFASSDFLVSFDWARDFSGSLENLPEGKTELITHPERDAEYEAIKRYL
jgi:predicted glycoside hydrolase/deacetylase ChbG (UPF0249 family)